MNKKLPGSNAFTLLELLVVVSVFFILIAAALPGLAGTKQRNKRMACLNNLRQMGAGSQMYAQDDSKGRLTGTLEQSPANQQADDDVNWLYGFGPGFRSYIPNVQTFVCPSTLNQIRTNVWMSVNYPPGSTQILVLLTDLKNLGRGNLGTNGHSYEVRGCWKDNPTYTRKTGRLVLTYAHQRAPLAGVVAGPSQTFIITDAVEPHNQVGWSWENWPNPYDCHGQDGDNVAFADGHAEWIGKASWNYRYELSEDEGRQLTPYN